MLKLLIVAAALAQPPESIDQFIARMAENREAVTRMAFDPVRFFPEERYGRNQLSILHRADEFGWPMYAVAVRLGCGGVSTGPSCDRGFRVRMARASPPAKMRRPRDRATAMLRRFQERKTRTPREMAGILDEVGIQWLQADSSTCPNALPFIARTAKMNWVSPELHSRVGGLPPSPVMHADSIEVVFDGHDGNARYAGHGVKGTPAAWALEFVEVLAPCWRPASPAAPWRTR